MSNNERIGYSQIGVFFFNFFHLLVHLFTLCVYCLGKPPTKTSAQLMAHDYYSNWWRMEP
jgi:hypothetical protein